MPVKREAQPLSEFFKFRNFGQLVIGQIDKFGKSGQYDTYFMVLTPAIIRATKDGIPRAFGSIAVGLSGDLMAKIDMKKDVGKYIGVEFVATEPGKKNSLKKLFDVSEFSTAEFNTLLLKADSEFARNAYRNDIHNIDDETEPPAVEGDDDLPF